MCLIYPYRIWVVWRIYRACKTSTPASLVGATLSALRNNNNNDNNNPARSLKIGDSVPRGQPASFSLDISSLYSLLLFLILPYILLDPVSSIFTFFWGGVNHIVFPKHGCFDPSWLGLIEVRYSVGRSLQKCHQECFSWQHTT